LPTPAERRWLPGRSDRPVRHQRDTRFFRTAPTSRPVPALRAQGVHLADDRIRLPGSIQRASASATNRSRDASAERWCVAKPVAQREAMQTPKRSSAV
jgi:hypothetical protein